ncbi:mucin-2-like [Ornithodoros turicata]|uniref:mucin-2-like n=1 Tax=Ornithodoros turicata TaxID=34597 RepID=UPI00313990BD
MVSDGNIGGSRLEAVPSTFSYWLYVSTTCKVTSLWSLLLLSALSCNLAFATSAAPEVTVTTPTRTDQDAKGSLGLVVTAEPSTTQSHPTGQNGGTLPSTTTKGSTPYRKSEYTINEKGYRAVSPTGTSITEVPAAPSSSPSYTTRATQEEVKATTSATRWNARQPKHTGTAALRPSQNSKVFFDSKVPKRKSGSGYEIPRASSIPRGAEIQRKTTARPVQSRTRAPKLYAKFTSTEPTLPLTLVQKKNGEPQPRSPLAPTNRFRQRPLSRTPKTTKVTYNEKPATTTVETHEYSKKTANAQEIQTTGTANVQTKVAPAPYHDEDNGYGSYKPHLGRVPQRQTLKTQATNPQEQHTRTDYTQPKPPGKVPEKTQGQTYKFKTPHSSRYMYFGKQAGAAPALHTPHPTVQTFTTEHVTAVPVVKTAKYVPVIHTGHQASVQDSSASQNVNSNSDKSHDSAYRIQGNPQQGSVDSGSTDGAAYKASYGTNYKHTVHQPTGLVQTGQQETYAPATTLGKGYSSQISHEQQQYSHQIPSSHTQHVQQSHVVYHQANTLPPTQTTSATPLQKVTQTSYSQPLQPPQRPFTATPSPSVYATPTGPLQHLQVTRGHLNAHQVAVPVVHGGNAVPVLQAPFPLPHGGQIAHDGRALLVEINNGYRGTPQQGQLLNHPVHPAGQPQLFQQVRQQGPFVQQYVGHPGFQHLQNVRQNQGFRVPVMAFSPPRHVAPQQPSVLSNLGQSLPQVQQPFLFGGPTVQQQQQQPLRQQQNQFFIPENGVFQKILTQGPVPLELKVQPLYGSNQPEAKEQLKVGQTAKNFLSTANQATGNQQQAVTQGANQEQIAAVNMLVDAAKKALLSAGNFPNQDVFFVDATQNGQLPPNVLQAVQQATGGGVNVVALKNAFSGQKNLQPGPVPTNVKVSDKLNVQLSGLVVPHHEAVGKHVHSGHEGKLNFNEPLNLHIPIGELPPRPAVNVRIKGPDGRISQVLVPLHDATKHQSNPSNAYQKHSTFQASPFQGSRGFHDIPAPNLSFKDGPQLGSSSNQISIGGVPLQGFQGQEGNVRLIEGMQLAELPFLNQDALAGAEIIHLKAS